MNAKIVAVEVDVEGVNFQFDQYGALFSNGQFATKEHMDAAMQAAYVYRNGGTCDVCCGRPLPIEGKCICGGRGTMNAAHQKYREALFDALRKVESYEATLKVITLKVINALKS